MTTLTEGQHKGEFLISSNENLSFDAVTFDNGNGVIADGTLVKLSSGKAVPITGLVDSDDSVAEEIAGIAYGSYDTTDAEIPGVIVARLAEVDSTKLTIPGSNDAGALAWLKKNLFIVAR